MSQPTIFDKTKTWAQSQALQCRIEQKCESTNDLAKNEAIGTNDALVLYLAGEQTKGRGRGNHHWVSPKAKTALLSSWSFDVAEPPKQLTGPIFGLALYKAALQTWPKLPWSLKAPNDLFLTDKKVAGLLIETILQGDKVRLIVGLGFNVNESPVEVDHATCLDDHLPATSLQSSEWTEFLTVLLATFSEAKDSCTRGSLTEKERSELLEALNNNPHLFEKLEEVKPDGSLVAPHRTVHWTEL